MAERIDLPHVVPPGAVAPIPGSREREPRRERERRRREDKVEVHGLEEGGAGGEGDSRRDAQGGSPDGQVGPPSVDLTA